MIMQKDSSQNSFLGENIYMVKGIVSNLFTT